MPLELHEQIGDGGFGDVWRGTDLLGRQVAVKVFRPGGEEISDALDHARALARIDHPNVVRVYAVDRVQMDGDGDEQDCIIMELVPGVTLSRHLEQGRLSRPDARQLGHDILAAMEAIHQAGLTHGDLHIENVMVANGRAKVIDILYRSTLSALSTASREARIRTDLAHSRMLLLEILGRTDIDPREATIFNNRLADRGDINTLRDAWEAATNPLIIDDLSRVLDNLVLRIDDHTFPRGDAYAAALAEETPNLAIKPLLLRLMHSPTVGQHHVPYLRAISARLSAADRADVLLALSDRLDTESPNGRWGPPILILKALGSSGWDGLRRTTALRLEQLLINDVLAGHYDIFSTPNLKRGALGTFANLFWRKFSNADQLLQNLCVLLRQGWYTQNYVAEFFWPQLPLLARDLQQRRMVITCIVTAVENDARIVKAKLNQLTAEWQAEVEMLVSDE